MTRGELLHVALLQATEEGVGIHLAKFADMCIEWGQQHPHWISVEDELPIDYEPVLAVVGGNHFAFVGICLNKKTWYCEIQNKAIEIIGITHWMPLPQAPKEGGTQ